MASLSALMKWVDRLFPVLLSPLPALILLEIFLTLMELITCER